jgi:hypothetical protein
MPGTHVRRTRHAALTGALFTPSVVSAPAVAVFESCPADSSQTAQVVQAISATP